MSLLDSIKKAIQPNLSNVETKDPGFVVTNFTKNTAFQNLIDPSDNQNYFDQYILYVYKCIDIISSAVASQDLDLYDLDNVEIEDNDLYRDLKHFNNYMTLWEALKLVVTHKALAGAAYWVMREPQNPKYKYDFFPLDPTRVTVKTDEFGLPSYYQYEDGQGQIVNFEPSSVIYFRRMDPKNWFEGMSQILPVRNLSNAYNAGTQFNMNKLLNDGMPDLFLWFEGISQTEKDAIDMKMRSKYEGVRNARRQGILGGKTKPEVIEMGKTQKDLDFVEGMKMLRQDILALFGVPEALVFPSATNGNTKESVKIFQQMTILPELKQILATLNEQLIPNYYGNNRIIDSIKFEFENPVDQDRLEQSQIVKNYVDAGFSFNDGLRLAGLPEIENGDIRKSDTQPIAIAADPILEQESQDLQEDDSKMLIELIENKFKSIEDRFFAESKLEEREVFKKKALDTAIQQEEQLEEVASDFFLGQAKLIIDSLSGKSVNLRTLPKVEDLQAFTIKSFKPAFENILAQSNSEGNVEIKQALYQKNKAGFLGYESKSLSMTSIKALEEYLKYFAKEIDTVTLRKLKKVIAKGIEEDKSSEQLKEDITGVFNGYIDGVKNIKHLKQYDAYVDAITYVKGEVIQGSTNRYNRMLEIITQKQANGEITLEVQHELLTSLKGIVNVADPVGRTVDNLLTSLYKVNKRSGISEKRATTISRTSATYTRNLGFEGTYDENPFVKSTEWVSAHDSATRHAHREADGQNTPKGVPFIVGGEKLKFPGDTSLGASVENIVNCRCRIVANVE